MGTFISVGSGSEPQKLMDPNHWFSIWASRLRDVVLFESFSEQERLRQKLFSKNKIFSSI